MLETFLESLSKGLPVADAEAFLAEAREHLEDSIQARLELGASLEEAEREALTAFGAAQRIARAAERAASIGRIVRARWLTAYWCLFAPLVLWSAFSTRSVPDALVAVICGLFSAVAIGFGLASFRGHRSMPFLVLGRSAIALLAGAGLLFATHVVVESDGFPQFVGRTQVAERVEQYRSMAGMVMDDRLRDTTGRSKDEIARQYLRWSDELVDAREHPLSNIPPTLHLVCIFGCRVALPPLAFDLLFGSLGWLANGFRVRRRSHLRSPRLRHAVDEDAARLPLS